MKRNIVIYAGWNRIEQQKGMSMQLALHHDL
jgi:hypothetical protein